MAFIEAVMQLADMKLAIKNNFYTCTICEFTKIIYMTQNITVLVIVGTKTIKKSD